MVFSIFIFVLMKTEDLLRLLLPEYLVAHFDIIKAYEKPEEHLHIEFEEKNIIPTAYENRTFNSKGFLPSITIEDFPLRGKTVKLHIKRRRWIDKQTGEILQRDWDLIAKGTRMTSDFASFLKEISRY